MKKKKEKEILKLGDNPYQIIIDNMLPLAAR
jgi:hypothetical protein